MDGLIRTMGLTAMDRIEAQRRLDDEAFRAWHRRPDAPPDFHAEPGASKPATIRHAFRRVLGASPG